MKNPGYATPSYSTIVVRVSKILVVRVQIEVPVVAIKVRPIVEIPEPRQES